jgi:group I intron endonuclease
MSYSRKSRYGNRKDNVILVDMQIKTCGIYDVCNVLNGKHYIGQSKHIERRLRHHKWLLNREAHCNAHLQNAWKLYGEKAFEFRIVEVCLHDKKLLCLREQYWMDYYVSLTSGYNIWHASESTDGYRHDAKTRLLLQQISNNRKLAVMQFNLEGNRVATFPDVDAAEKHTGAAKENIRSCCLGKSLSAKGFYWVYIKDYAKNGQIPSMQTGKTPRPERCVVKLTKEFEQVDEYATLKAAARSVGTQHCAIGKVCRGDAYFIAGHRWMYKDDYLDADRLFAYKHKTNGKGRYIEEQKNQ